MSKAIESDKTQSPHSRAPKSGRSHIDPLKYQMSTVPTEVVAELAKLRYEGPTEDSLRPPPVFDQRPIIGKLRRLGEWLARNKRTCIASALLGLLAIGALLLRTHSSPPATPAIRQEPVMAPRTALTQAPAVRQEPAVTMQPAPATATETKPLSTPAATAAPTPISKKPKAANREPARAPDDDDIETPIMKD